MRIRCDQGCDQFLTNGSTFGPGLAAAQIHANVTFQVNRYAKRASFAPVDIRCIDALRERAAATEK